MLISDASTNHSVDAFQRRRRRRRRRRIDARVKVHAAQLTGAMLSTIILVGLHRIGPTAAFVGCHKLNQHRLQSHAQLATATTYRFRICQRMRMHRPNNPVSPSAAVQPRFLEGTRKQDQVKVSPALFAEEKDCDGDAKAMELIGSEEEWKEYYDTADGVLSAAKTFGRKDSEEDKLAVRVYLLRRESIVPIRLPTLVSKANGAPSLSTTTNDGVDSSLHSELEVQKELFCEASSLTPAQQKLALRVLGYIGNYCAKKRACLPLRVGWHKLKEMGAPPRENVLSTYLYGLALAEERDEEVTTSEEVSISLPEEVATFHDSLFQPTEKTLTLRIKVLVQKGDAVGAERLLEMMPSNKDGGDFRLRTYLPILELYCEQGDIGSALGLYKRMRRAPGVHFNAENYSLLISAIADRGFFRDDSAPIDGAADIGYSPAMGSQLLSALISEMAEDVLEITSSCASQMRTAFIEGFGLNLDDEAKEQFNEDPSVVAPSSPFDLVVDRVCVDEETAICPRTNATLRLIALDKAQRSQLHDTLEEMANSQYAEYDEKLKQRKQIVEENDEGYAAKQLRNFAEWIDGRDGDPYTAIVDGANVAFFGRGVVEYHHVKAVVEGLEKMGENVLVIMPQKYLQRKFYIRKGNVQDLNDRDWSIVEDLIEKEKVYEVRKRCLDDYYWMLASVSDQTAARKGMEIDVPPNNPEGRWPGLRPIIVSNDQMRDHKLELLQPRLFRRWVSSFIIKYDFTSVVDEKWDEREVIFSPAEHFSREIQENSCPDGQMTWHFPVSEWGKDERFCIKLPRLLGCISSM